MLHVNGIIFLFSDSALQYIEVQFISVYGTNIFLTLIQLELYFCYLKLNVNQYFSLGFAKGWDIKIYLPVFTKSFHMILFDPHSTWEVCKVGIFICILKVRKLRPERLSD